ncbi:decapping and exoribonuclease protein Rai1-like [Eurosta solidaginis]|uniref:decapping and exoribonuclease protein Rai1-like n=1 Tax=Eurosta solidaginis TaxID=178769 RepID=UPI0035316DE3
MADFNILLKLSNQELTQNNKAELYLSRPEMCALYQHTKTDEITDDFRLKYFKTPKSTSYPLDLNKGFEQYVFRRQQTQLQLLNKVIKFIMEANENIIQQYSDSLKAETPKTVAASDAQPLPELEKSPVPPKRKLVVSQRGVLARFMLIPYRTRGSVYNNITFYATRYRGILHLSGNSEQNGHTKNDTYHGKFEQICFSDDTDLEPITDVPVEDNITTYAIFRSDIEEFDLLYSAEVSGVISNHKINDIHNIDEIRKLNFIQTKVMWTREYNSKLSHPKCMQWWAQSYLANTNDICIGRKDRDGFVRTPAQIIKVKDIPKNQIWKPTVCIRFLYTILTLLDETLSKVDDPHTVYDFIYDSYAGCIKWKVHNGKTKLSFLPDDYIKHCDDQTSSK